MTTIDDLAIANAKAGNHWFTPGSISFFQTKFETPVYAERYFITSECGPFGMKPRKFTIREAIDNGAQIQTVNDFQQYATLTAAKKALKPLVRGYIE